jgi:nicotinamidase/pyrazinamidase
MKALLLIGMQIDLGPGGGAEVPGSGDLEKIISELIPQYEVVAAANYWLPVEHQMFAANHPWRKPGQPMEVGGAMTELRNFFCIQISFGAELFMGLDASKIQFTAQMGTQPDRLPHSAFFDSKKSIDTGLAHFFREKKVTEIHLAGMPLETILKNTALDGLELGFEMTVLKNACRGMGENAAEVFLEMEKAGVNIMGS